MAEILIKPNVPLYNGKRFTFEEYLNLEDDGYQYEIIQGVMCMTPSPAYEHQSLSFKLSYLLESFLEANPIGVALAAPRDVRLSRTLSYQPDILFVSNERMAINKRQYVDGAPDFVIEILSPGTRLKDIQDKREDYEKYGVREYWILDPADLADASQFYVLEREKYVPFYPDKGLVHAKTLPGFAIDLEDLAKKIRFPN